MIDSIESVSSPFATLSPLHFHLARHHKPIHIFNRITVAHRIPAQNLNRYLPPPSTVTSPGAWGSTATSSSPNRTRGPVARRISIWSCESQHAPHGYVHVWIGGMLNCDDTMTTLTELVGRDNAVAIKKGSMNRKSYWQNGMFECKGSADADVPVEEVCVCVVCICRTTQLANEQTSVVVSCSCVYCFTGICRANQLPNGRRLSLRAKNRAPSIT